MTLFFQQLANGLSLGFAYALIAVGFTLVFGTLKILNFAQSAIIMLAGFVALVAVHDLGLGIVLGLVAAVLAGAALGAGLERTLIRPVRRQSFIAPFIVTLGAAMVMEAAAKSRWGSEPHSFPSGFPTGVIELAGVRISVLQLIVAATAVVAMVALGWLVNRTRVGLQVRATAADPEMAQASGINTDRLSLGTMALAGGVGGLAGVLLAASFGIVSPFVGATYGLKGMVAMIIGGIGSLRGAVVAGVAIGVGEVMTVAYISSSWRDAIAFGALALVLLWRPSGLFGSGKDERFVPASL